MKYLIILISFLSIFNIRNGYSQDLSEEKYGEYLWHRDVNEITYEIRSMNRVLRELIEVEHRVYKIRYTWGDGSGSVSTSRDLSDKYTHAYTFEEWKKWRIELFKLEEENLLLRNEINSKINSIANDLAFFVGLYTVASHALNMDPFEYYITSSSNIDDYKNLQFPNDWHGFNAYIEADSVNDFNLTLKHLDNKISNTLKITYNKPELNLDDEYREEDFFDITVSDCASIQVEKNRLLENAGQNFYNGKFDDRIYVKSEFKKAFDKYENLFFRYFNIKDKKEEREYLNNLKEDLKYLNNLSNLADTVLIEYDNIIKSENYLGLIQEKASTINIENYHDVIENIGKCLYNNNESFLPKNIIIDNNNAVNYSETFRKMYLEQAEKNFNSTLGDVDFVNVESDSITKYIDIKYFLIKNGFYSIIFNDSFTENSYQTFLSSLAKLDNEHRLLYEEINRTKNKIIFKISYSRYNEIYLYDIKKKNLHIGDVRYEGLIKTFN